MTNSNAEILKEIRDYVKSGKPIDPELKDRFILSAILDIYETQDEMNKRIAPMISFYKAAMVFVSLSGTAIFGLVWTILTGRIELVYK